MNKESIAILSSELADKNKVIDFARNSFFNMIKTTNGTSSDYHEMVALTSNAVKKDINLFKNKLLPLCAEYRDAVNVYISKYTVGIDTSRYNIKVVGLPKAVTELIARGVISTHGYDAMDLPIASLVIPTPDANGIRDYIKSSSPIMNSYLEEIVNEMTDDYIINLWDMYFTNVSGSNENIEMLSNDQTMDIGKLVVLYTITTNIIKNIPNGVRVSEVGYTKIMTAFKDKIGIDLGNMVKKYKTIESQNKLIITIKDNTVYVVKSVYDEFLKNNSVDTILGMLFVTDLSMKNYYLNDIVINSGKYIAAWNNYIKLEKVKIKSNEVSVYRLAYEYAIEELYTDTDPIVKDLFAYDLSEIKNIVADLMKNYGMEDLTNITGTCNQLIINAILTKTNLGMFLDSMVTYGKMDKTLSPEEVASLATLDLITEYALAQIVISE